MRDDSIARTSALPIWAAAFPIAAGLYLLWKAWVRELILQAGLLNPSAVLEPWYTDHASLTRVHLVTGALLTTLGFLQFVPRIRTKFPAVHRWTGRAVVGVAAAAAFTGIWMNLVFPYGGFFKHLGGYFFGVVVLASAVLGVRAIRRGDVFGHRAWMSRAFAIAIAAGVQRLLMSTWMRLTGSLDDTMVGVCLWTAAAIALSINELLLRRARNA